jgi:hypothetical protein
MVEQVGQSTNDGGDRESAGRNQVEKTPGGTHEARTVPVCQDDSYAVETLYDNEHLNFKYTFDELPRKER